MEIKPEISDHVQIVHYKTSEKKKVDNKNGS